MLKYLQRLKNWKHKHFPPCTVHHHMGTKTMTSLYTHMHPAHRIALLLAIVAAIANHILCLAYPSTLTALTAAATTAILVVVLIITAATAIEHAHSNAEITAYLKYLGNNP